MKTPEAESVRRYAIEGLNQREILAQFEQDPETEFILDPSETDNVSPFIIPEIKALFTRIETYIENVAAFTEQYCPGQISAVQTALLELQKAFILSQDENGTVSMQPKTIATPAESQIPRTALLLLESISLLQLFVKKAEKLRKNHETDIQHKKTTIQFLEDRSKKCRKDLAETELLRKKVSGNIAETTKCDRKITELNHEMSQHDNQRIRHESGIEQHGKQLERVEVATAIAVSLLEEGKFEECKRYILNEISSHNIVVFQEGTLSDDLRVTVNFDIEGEIEAERANLEAERNKIRAIQRRLMVIALCTAVSVGGAISGIMLTKKGAGKEGKENNAKPVGVDRYGVSQDPLLNPFVNENWRENLKFAMQQYYRDIEDAQIDMKEYDNLLSNMDQDRNPDFVDEIKDKQSDAMNTVGINVLSFLAPHLKVVFRPEIFYYSTHKGDSQPRTVEQYILALELTDPYTGTVINILEDEELMSIIFPNRDYLIFRTVTMLGSANGTSVPISNMISAYNEDGIFDVKPSSVESIANTLPEEDEDYVQLGYRSDGDIGNPINLPYTVEPPELLESRLQFLFSEPNNITVCSMEESRHMPSVNGMLVIRVSLPDDIRTELSEKGWLFTSGYDTADGTNLTLKQPIFTSARNELKILVRSGIKVLDQDLNTVFGLQLNPLLEEQKIFHISSMAELDELEELPRVEQNIWMGE